MNFTKVFLPLVVAFAGLFLVSCSDDGGLEIEITGEPSSAVAVGDTVNFTVNVTDDNSVSTVAVSSEDLNISRSEVTGLSGTDFSQGFSFVVPDGTEAGDYEITVTATDDEDNEADESFDIEVQ